jgi:hypothetical protein
MKAHMVTISIFVDCAHNYDDCANIPDDQANTLVDSTDTPNLSSLNLCILNPALL